MTYEELMAKRELAGARYAAALAELREALVDLVGLDETLSNDNVNHRKVNVQTFCSIPDGLQGFAHPVFAPHQPLHLRQEMGARRDAYLGAYIPPASAPVL